MTQTEHGPLEAGSFGIDEQARTDLQSATASEPHIRPNRGRSVPSRESDAARGVQRNR